MNKRSATIGMTAKVLTLIIGLSSMVLVTGLVGCAGDRYTQSTGERIDDRGTSSAVKNAFGEDTQYKFGGVNVETFKGVVQLSGFVNSKDEKNRAGDLAKSVHGVKEVKNNLIVKTN